MTTRSPSELARGLEERLAECQEKLYHVSLCKGDKERLLREIHSIEEELDRPLTQYNGGKHNEESN